MEDLSVLEGDLPGLPNTAVMSYVRSDKPHPYSQRFVDYLMASVAKG